MSLDTASPLPARTLHQRIRDDIEGRILSGEWGPGHRIPFEHELMADYGCARMTVNKALSALVDAGLIERRRRAGTFVRRPAVPAVVLQIPDVQADVASRGWAYACTVLSRTRRKATRADCARIGVEPGAPVLAVLCRHDADGRPYGLEDRLIALDAVPEAMEADFAQEPPGTWLLHHVPWHRAEHRIAAANADSRISGLLELDEGTACLVVDRRTWRSADPITAVRMWYPGDRQTFVAAFTPTTMGGGA